MTPTREQRTQFDYLLNAVDAAAQHENPAAHGYAEKRQALFAYVRGLENRAALATPPPADLAAQVETLTREKQAAEQRHAALVAVVKRVQDKRETLEWNGDRGMEYTAPIVCPACNEPEHTADCPLDALLAYPLGDTTP